MASIVVGVDGSPEAAEALRFALGEARLRGAEILAVAAWDVPPGAYGGARSVVLAHEFFREEGRRRLDRSLEAAGVLAAGVAVTTRLAKGDAAHVLCEAARDADLLVLGSRGLGSLETLVAGSVGQYCAGHAACPVAIVPARRREAGATGTPQPESRNP